MANVACWELVHVAGRSALQLPLDQVEALVPVGHQKNSQQWLCLKELASLLGFPVKTAHSFQVQVWEPEVGKMKGTCAAHCTQVAKAASSAGEEKEELTAGKQLSADKMKIQRVKEVSARDLLEVVSELVEACLAE